MPCRIPELGACPSKPVADGWLIIFSLFISVGRYDKIRYDKIRYDMIIYDKIRYDKI